jgi:hypothetical protein
MSYKSALLGVGFAFFVSQTEANVIYNVNDTVWPDTLTGTITTDGSLGVLNSGDIVSWDLTITITHLQRY